jgi:hypothetical protein
LCQMPKEDQTIAACGWNSERITAWQEHSRIWNLSISRAKRPGNCVPGSQYL